MRLWRAVAMALALIESTPAVAEVPAPMAVVVMLKVITYDAAFDAENRSDFVVCIPYVAAQKSAAEQTVKALEGVASSKLGAHKVRVKAIDAEHLAAALEAEHASAVLLLPETPKAVALEQRDLATKRKLYMLALDPAMVSAQHAMLGVAEENGKPKIVLNTTLAKAAGVELSASVLKVARLVHETP